VREAYALESGFVHWMCPSQVAGKPTRVGKWLRAYPTNKRLTPTTAATSPAPVLLWHLARVTGNNNAAIRQMPLYRMSMSEGRDSLGWVDE